MKAEEHFAAGSILGNRSRQEDSFGFLLRKRTPATLRFGDPGLLAALADGMGGHECGEIASRVACEQFLREANKSGTIDAAAMVQAARAANAEVRKQAKQNPKCGGMGCTLVGAYISPGRLSWLSVGDSHLYLFRQGALNKLNEDHSLAPVLDRLVEKGELSEDDARMHPDRNALRSAISGQELSLIDCPASPFRLENDDIVLLASDGVDVLNDKELGSAIGDRRNQHARHIVDAVLHCVENAEAVAQDNATVMVIKFSRAADNLRCGPLRAQAALSSGVTGAAERLVHDAADGARAAAALGAAAETAIDLAGRARPLRLDGGTDILIAQHIARTDNHGAMVLDGDLVRP